MLVLLKEETYKTIHSVRNLRNGFQNLAYIYNDIMTVVFIVEFWVETSMLKKQLLG